MKKLASLKGVKTLNKREQKNIQGGTHDPRHICDVICPSYCDCVDAYSDYCVFNSGPREGQFCYDL